MLDTESPTPTKLAVGMVQGLRSEWKVGNRDTTGTFGTVCVTRQGTWGGYFCLEQASSPGLQPLGLYVSREQREKNLEGLQTKGETQVAGWGVRGA